VDPPVSIVITSRNRCGEALAAVESALAQEYSRLEVLLYDDASVDDTAAVVRSTFPGVRVFRNDTQLGYIACRNRGFRDACGEYIVSIDDDAYFTSPQTISTVVNVFQRNPDVAAVAMAYIEPRSGRSASMTARDSESPIRNFIGCAHAIRREAVLQVGQYREFLVHQGEERDLCLRLTQKGWKILFANTPPIVHLYSSRRSQYRLNYYGFRNTILVSALNVPHPYCVPRMFFDSAQLLKYRFQLKSVPWRIKAIFDGWVAAWRYRKFRRPVSRRSYCQFRSLPGHGPLPSPAGGAIPAPLKCTESNVVSERCHRSRAPFEFGVADCDCE
jgi:GT2 family glycosyltransferase